jgi:hypothetical protein
MHGIGSMRPAKPSMHFSDESMLLAIRSMRLHKFVMNYCFHALQSSALCTNSTILGMPAAIRGRMSRAEHLQPADKRA